MSKVNWIRPLVLALFLLGIGTFAYWLEYSHKPQSEEKEEQSKKIFKLKNTSVTSIRIIDEKSRFSFRCLDLDSKLCKPSDHSRWELTEPLKVRADDAYVNNFLDTLNNLTSQETIDLSSDSAEKQSALLKDYQLNSEQLKDDKKRRIEITSVQGEKQVLYLGLTHPIGDTIFALLESIENKVFLLPGYFKNQFEHDLAYWRDKKLFTLSTHEIQKFDLKGTKIKLLAEKKDGRWSLKVTSPGKIDEIPGDIENIDTLLRELTFLSAKKFVSEKKLGPSAKKTLNGFMPIVQLTAYPATKPTPSPTSTLSQAVPVTLTFYEKKKSGKSEALYATVSNLDPIFELDLSNKDKVDKSLKDLRLSKLVTTMDRFGSKKIEFTGKPMGSAPLLLAQKDGKWQLPSNDGGEADSDKIQTLLDKLSGSKIQDFLHETHIPTGEQEGVQVTLLDEKDVKKRSFVFWKGQNSQKDKLFARDLLTKRKEAFLVDSDLRNALPWARDFFKKPIPAAASPKPMAGAKN